VGSISRVAAPTGSIPTTPGTPPPAWSGSMGISTRIDLTSAYGPNSGATGFWFGLAGASGVPSSRVSRGASSCDAGLDDPASVSISIKCKEASKMSPHCPHFTQPSEIRSWSGTTL
jgi:hypothetical protein